MKNRILIILILVFVLLSCNLPSAIKGNETAAPIASEPIVVQESPAAENQTAITAAPPPQEEMDNTGTYDCRGVSLSLSQELASGIRCEVVSRSEVGAWEVYPEYDLLHLDGYVLQDTFHQAEISVYPIAEYQSMSPEISKIIAELDQFLKDRPENPEDIPFLPFFNAAQMMRSKIQYIDFQNGSGVRFLTQYAQAAYPINNRDLFYTFQGITSDGKYYISAILPVSNPDLPATGDTANTGDWAAFSENFGTYIADTTLQMNTVGDDTFNPSLTVLDDLIKSIKAE